MLEIYELPMVLLITPIANPLICFIVRTITYSPKAMTINRLPDLSSIAENVKMKYFTLETIQRPGGMIELKNPNLFLTEIC